MYRWIGPKIAILQTMFADECILICRDVDYFA